MSFELEFDITCQIMQINVMNGMGRRKRSSGVKVKPGLDPRIRSLARHAMNAMQDFVKIGKIVGPPEKIVKSGTE